MISSNTRASRSRISSPQQAQPGPSNSSSSTPATKGAAEEEPKTFMQKWLEPPVQVKPSFQDAGLVRHGVVEGMAPLGTMPKVGIFKKTATPVDGPPPRKIVLKRPAAPSTPISTPTNNNHPEEDDTEEEKDNGTKWEGAGDEDESFHAAPPSGAGSNSRRSLAMRDAEDDDYAPATKAASSGHKIIARRSLVPRATGRSGYFSSPVADQQQRPTTPDSSSHTANLKALVDKVVEIAVDEALDHFRYPTAWALRTLYDENSADPRFLTIVEEVYSQTASSETLEEFSRLLHQKKKEGKKGNKGCYYFIPPTTNSRFTPHKPKRAPYASLVRLEVPKLQLDPKPEPRTPSVDHSDTHLRKKRRSSKFPEKSSSTPSASKMGSSKTASPKQPANGGGGGGGGGVNGKGKSKLVTPSRRKTRANSASSTSSLSSARSMTPPGGEENGDIFDVPPSRNSPAAENSTNAPAVPSQPITRGRRSLPAKKNGNVSHTPTPSSPTSTQQQRRQSATAAAKSSMPSAASAAASSAGPSLFPNLASKKPQRKGAAALAEEKPVFPSKVGTIDQNDERQRFRDNARRVTNNIDTGVSILESYTRGSGAGASTKKSEASTDAPRRPVGRPRKSLPASNPPPPPASSGPSGTGPNLRSTRSSRKRSHDELDDQVSPTTKLFPPSEAASTAATSRAGTPSLRPAKKTRTGLRVKSSPMKKKTGTSAGIPRASGERNSPMANGAVTKEDDNDDYCSSCGGNGDLVCCDGCTRSFHVDCLDPPLNEDRMPAEWFCNVCLSTRSPANVPPPSGAFRALQGKLDGRNSSAFRLPGEVREFFEDVRTGVDGEFEAVVVIPKPTRKRKAEEDQGPDFFRLRDNDGNAVLCHGCRKATSDNRAIIPCSVCGLWWHLDCLDPPLANPPVLRTWRCPAHIDDILAKLPAYLGPAHKFRKIKGAQTLEPVFSRGNINNGFIDVAPDESEDNSGWKDVAAFGRTYKLPEKGIMLDFLTRCRANRKGKPIPPLLPGSPASSSKATPAPPAPLATRGFDEQQAALNLARMSGQAPSGVKTLIDALLTEADPNVVSMMARGNLDNVNKQKLDQFDKQSLTAMLAQMEEMSIRIKGALQARSDDESTAPSMNGVPATPAKTVEATASKAAEVDSKPEIVASNPPATLVSGKENLPSPAATECVTSTQSEEISKGVDGDNVSAINEKTPNDEGLPDGLTNEVKTENEDTATEPASDDKTAVDEQAMEVD